MSEFLLFILGITLGFILGMVIALNGVRDACRKGRMILGGKLWRIVESE